MNLLLWTPPDSLAQSSPLRRSRVHLPHPHIPHHPLPLVLPQTLLAILPRRYSQLDLVLGTVGLGVTIAVSIVTILRCRNAWQLLVIAVWKLDVSGLPLFMWRF